VLGCIFGNVRGAKGRVEGPIYLLLFASSTLHYRVQWFQLVIPQPHPFFEQLGRAPSIFKINGTYPKRISGSIECSWDFTRGRGGGMLLSIKYKLN